jgi:hypothetical protein
VIAYYHPAGLAPLAVALADCAVNAPGYVAAIKRLVALSAMNHRAFVAESPWATPPARMTDGALFEAMMLIRGEPLNFGAIYQIAILFIHNCQPAMSDEEQAALDALERDVLDIRLRDYLAARAG